MSIDPLVELKFSEEFKNKLRDLSKKYRNIRADLQPVLDDLQAGNFQGDQIANVGYTVFKLRIKNRDNKKGKSAGYRVIYYVKTATSVFLVTIYSKSEQSNIPAAEIRRILANMYTETAKEVVAIHELPLPPLVEVTKNLQPRILVVAR